MIIMYFLQAVVQRNIMDLGQTVPFPVQIFIVASVTIRLAPAWNVKKDTKVIRVKKVIQVPYFFFRSRRNFNYEKNVTYVSGL